jgi:uncharacterized protein (DUF983 family)
MASALAVGFLGRCPRCGKGKLFCGILKIMPECPDCHLSLAAQDSGDGPAFFGLVIVEFLIVGMAAFVELRYTPPLWLHAVLWIPFTIILTIVVLRFFKVWLIAIQYKHNPSSFI